MVPLQVPGATELIIILLNLLIVAGFIGGLVYLVRRFGGSDDDKDERIEELENRVEELEREKES
ncbi:hypothetical protein [Halosimplex salinum]|uniref:hypothetical protein n=1 Tax=Halosimplex salinum TaxID=1710538 RepID=UPI000F48FFDE|nr:hypothetical protein [Halosimplex salinum]